jgi:hypothetical protein
VIGSAFMAGGFICLAPLIAKLLSPILLLIYLHTPGYMIHQVEEHAGDRFRRFVNDHLFGGLDVLTTGDVLVINLPVVWGLDLVALYAGYFYGAGYGLVAPYAMLVNALTHFAAAIRLRSYNPGLVTAAIVFVPLGLATIVLIGAQATRGQHLLGFGLAVLLHVVIFAFAAFRFVELQRRAAA